MNIAKQHVLLVIFGLFEMGLYDDTYGIQLHTVKCSNFHILRGKPIL